MAEMRKVKCNGCGNEWESGAKPENLKCKKCDSIDIFDSTGPTPEVPIEETKPTPAPPPTSAVPPPTAKFAKGQQQLEAEADKARRKAVDLDNKRSARESEEREKALAKIPLTADERAFVAEIGAKMNNGRRITMPSSADILKYSQLKARMKAK